MSFYLNIDDINFDNTERQQTDAIVKGLSSINIAINAQEEVEGNMKKKMESKEDTRWSLFKHKIAKQFKFFKFKH